MRTRPDWLSLDSGDREDAVPTSASADQRESDPCDEEGADGGSD